MLWHFTIPQPFFTPQSAIYTYCVHSTSAVDIVLINNANFYIKNIEVDVKLMLN